MELIVTSSDFKEGNWIPTRNTARGADLSPAFQLKGIDKRAQSMAITMDDASHPLFKNYNHWVIWNVPVKKEIEGGIPKGAEVKRLGNAKQGMAYGRHCYKGPKPPFKSIHTYVFTFYILDAKIELSEGSTKKELLKKIQGHVLQQSTLSGKYQSYRKES